MKRAGSPVAAASPKRPRAQQKFKATYSKEFPCMVVSSVSEFHGRCLICEIDVKCSSGGRNDLLRHVETINHKLKAKPKQSTSLTSFFSLSPRPKKAATTATTAEAMMCQVLVSHNLPFSAMDSVSEFVRQAFPDSEIAAAFKCGRTKATALVKELSSVEIHHLAESMKRQPFSIATDGSNDTGTGVKHYPLVVRVSNGESVETGLLALCICEGQSTGKNIFDLLDQEFKTHGIPWRNCLAIGTDNAPNMVGHNSGVIAFSRDRHEGIYKSGCVLHLVHIAAKKGSEHLCALEEALVEIFHFFKKSSLRQSELKDFQDLYNVEVKKCLKHVSTRWLSIQRCVDRLLKNWEPLKAYFLNQKSSRLTAFQLAKVESIFNFLRSPTNKLLSIFQLYLTKLFDSVLKRLQAEEPLIHDLRPSMERLLREILSKFVKPEAILGHDVFKVDFEDVKNIKEPGDLGIGVDALDFIEKKAEHHLRDHRIADFYASVVKCYQAVCLYLKKSLPWEDRLLEAISVVDIRLQLSSKSTDLLYLLRRYPSLLEDDSSLDAYLSMFELFKVTDVTNCADPRLDMFWGNIKKAHNSLAGLCDVMLALLTIPHSSATCERVFSCVRKNLTEQRSSLGDKTLESLLVLKTTGGDIQAKLKKVKEFDQETLDRLKSACRANQ